MENLPMEILSSQRTLNESDILCFHQCVDWKQGSTERCRKIRRGVVRRIHCWITQAAWFSTIFLSEESLIGHGGWKGGRGGELVDIKYSSGEEDGVMLFACLVGNVGAKTIS